MTDLQTEGCVWQPGQTCVSSSTLQGCVYGKGGDCGNVSLCSKKKSDKTAAGYHKASSSPGSGL